MSLPTDRPERGLSALVLLPGFAWGAVQFVFFGFVTRPGPETAGQMAILFFLCLFLGVAHAGAFAAIAAALEGVRIRWLARAADAIVALAAGAGYAWLALSLVKFGQTRSHLNLDDLRFLVASVRQVGGEGTAAERQALAVAAVLPLALAVVLFALLRRVRRHGGPLSARAALALVAVGLAGLGAVEWRYPVARWASATLLSDTSAVARAVARARAPDPARGWHADPQLQARIAPYRPEATPARWNVVVVMLESVPWRRVFGPDARPGSTPNLAELAREGVVFDRAYATSTHSDYAQTSILASLFPRHGDGHDYFLDLDYPRALPWDVLSPLGWRSAVVSSQNENWGNMIAFVRTPELGYFRHSPDFPEAPRRGEGSQTKIFEAAVVDDFLAWTAREPERPFVAYLNFQATHFPYVWGPGFTPPYGEAPLDFEATFLGYPRERVPRMLDRFHNALAYADRELGRLVAGLREQGRWEKTALVVVADHGEAFYEHGIATHGTTLLEEQVRVPLVVRLPGVAPRAVVEPVSVLDVMPLVYREMGLPRHGALQGRDDVLDASYRGGERPIFFTIQGMTHEDGVLAGGFKLIVNHDRREAALFAVDRDPDERLNLVAAEPARRDALVGVLERFFALQLGYYRARGWESGWFAPRLP